MRGAQRVRVKHSCQPKPSLTGSLHRAQRFALILSLGLALLSGLPVRASEFNSSLYYNNDIVFYNPNECEEPGMGAVGSYDGTATAGLSEQQAAFVDQYHDIAEKLSIKYGIPWETVMAQGILESAAGTSYFATTRNNFFGIGAFDSNPNNAFSYATPEEGWEGYYKNIVATGVYRANGAFNYPDDPYAYAQAIKNAGYATDPNYVSKLHSLITPIIERAKQKGWETSEELVKSHPEMREAAERNARGEGGDVEIGSTTALDECCVTGSSNVQWEEGWITSGMPGYEKESAIEADAAGTFNLEDSAYKSEYSTGGKPNKILLHNTEGGRGDGSSGLALYGGGYPAHFTIDLQERKVWQHLPITKPACAIVGDLAAGVQIEIIGFSTEKDKNSDLYILNYGEDEWAYLATLLKAISAETGIPLTSDVEWTPGTPRLGTDAFASYEGILGHMHAPNNDHVDPGNIWPMVEEALGGSGSSSTEFCEAGVKIGGLNESEARALLKEFTDLADAHMAGGYTYKGYYFGDFCMDGPFYNCVALPRWFVIEYTTVPQAADCAGPGWSIANCMSGYEGFTRSSEPKAYSIFSYGDGSCNGAGASCLNHTGLVVNVNSDKSIDVIQSSCSGGQAAVKGYYGYQTIPYETWNGFYNFAQIDDSIIKKS